MKRAVTGLSTRRRRRRRPYTIARYSAWAAGLSLVVWLAFLLLSAFGGLELFGSQARVARANAIWIGIWTGFFVAFVSTFSNSLQARRLLLIGLLEPSVDEWDRLELRIFGPDAGPGGFWLFVVLTSLGLAVALGALMAASGSFGDAPGVSRISFVVGTAVVPACCAAVLAVWSIRRSIRRFVSAVERDEPQRLSRGRYVLVHNVIPYALFNTAVGVAVAFSRFLRDFQQRRPIAAHDISFHLALAALVICLIVVGVSRAKTRVDFLSPILLTGSSRPRAVRCPRWRAWYALVIPVAIYAALRIVLLAAGQESVRVGTAVVIKVGVCLTLSLATAWWAVTSTLRDMEAGGLDEHRYVRLHRFMRRAGLIRFR